MWLCKRVFTSHTHTASLPFSSCTEKPKTSQFWCGRTDRSGKKESSEKTRSLCCHFDYFNCQKALFYLKENLNTFICMKPSATLIHSYKINLQTAGNVASMFRSRAVQRQHIFSLLAEFVSPLFKCAILSCCSWNRWVIKLDWARSPTLQCAGSLWYEGGRLSHNHLLMGRFASLQQSFFGWWCVSHWQFMLQLQLGNFLNSLKLRLSSVIRIFTVKHWIQ